MGAPPQATLTITMTTDGQIQVAGPISDKILCYGLLAVAHDIIAAHVTEPESKILTPPPGLSVPRF